MRIVCISDTHELHRSIEVPDGDLLIHAGDITSRGEAHVMQDFLEWWAEQPHKHKVFVAGNHDFILEHQKPRDVGYLEDEEINVGGLTVYGSPMTPTFGDWAFMEERGAAIKKHWDKIPDNIDILVTHGPPHGILDMTPPRWGSKNAGCEALLKAVRRTKPLLHVFGHIHHSYGQVYSGGTNFVNAAICTERYIAENKPWVVNL